MELNQKTVHRSFANAANEKRIDLINQGLDKKVTLLTTDKNENGKAAGTKIIHTISFMK